MDSRYFYIYNSKRLSSFFCAFPEGKSTFLGSETCQRAADRRFPNVTEAGPAPRVNPVVIFQIRIVDYSKMKYHIFDDFLEHKLAYFLKCIIHCRRNKITQTAYRVKNGGVQKTTARHSEPPSFS